MVHTVILLLIVGILALNYGRRRRSTSIVASTPASERIIRRLPDPFLEPADAPEEKQAAVEPACLEATKPPTPSLTAFHRTLYGPGLCSPR